MGSWKAFVGVGLVFVVGVLAGLIPGFYFTHRFPPPPPPPSMDPAHRDAMMIERLSKDLSLTEEQKARVKPIVSRMNEKLDGQFRDMQPKVQQIFDEGFTEIGKQLNDDQKSRFRSLRERMERGKGHRPPPPPFP
jgi:Spy/CpxP family protein refolding chaperone